MSLLLLLASVSIVGSTATIADATDRFGAPDFQYELVLAKLDPFVSPASEGDSKGALVQVLEWRNDDGQRIVMVFRKSGLWYSRLPVRSSESTLERVKSRFGGDPKQTRHIDSSGDLDISYDAFVFAPDHVAYLRSTSDVFEFKVVWH